MKIKFWGVRGSIASPGQKTAKYGGNTSCIEIYSEEKERIILDAGTGIFPLAQQMLSIMPVTCSLFISHTHWDHIQGLPFFTQMFIPNNSITIYGAFDPVFQKNIEEILSRQMEYCYFPVRVTELMADIKYNNIFERQTINVGPFSVTPILMNHPVLNYGYKIESDGKSVFFTGDHEKPYNIYEPEDDFYEEYEELIAQKNQNIIDFIKGVDVLIADSAYTTEEYPSKKGWGHGTFDTSIHMALKAGVSNLYFTHHEPTRSDEALEKIYKEKLSEYSDKLGDMKLYLAREGLTVEVT